MGKLVTGQWGLRGKAAPLQSPLTRVAALEYQVGAGIGVDGFQYTEPLGNSLRVLQLDVWLCAVTYGVLTGVFFGVSVGVGVPGSAGVVLLEWTPLVKNVGTKPYPRITFQQQVHLHWDMNQLFKGEPWRVAFWLGNLSATDATYGWCTVVHSEG